jgi:hypothetical protein
MNSCRDADASRLCQCLQSRSDVDSVPQKVFSFDHDVALMDSDADLDRLLGGCLRVTLVKLLLNAHRGFESLNSARKFGEQPIAHKLEEAPAMLGEDRVDDAPAYLA